MKKYFDKENGRLVFSGVKSDATYWDKHWEDNDIRKSIERNRDYFVSRFTKKYLQPKKEVRILEGGCGKGQFVYSLKKAGYDAFGVDYAKETVEKINTIIPELNVSYGDVSRLDFEDNFFDGYWSIGVIEHFFNGYEEISNEMHRVIKPGGYLFMTFPYMSPLRKFKSRMNKYLPLNVETFSSDEFYQFALDHESVIKKFEDLGFSIARKVPFDGIKGLKDEVTITHDAFQKIYTSKNIGVRALKILISIICSPFSSHSILLILRKK